MARNVRLDFRRGGGSSLEVLYGKVSLTPTNLHTLSSTAVLPAPTTFDLVNGTALATNVAPTPAPVDGLLPWGYKVKITDNFGKTWEYLVGVPDGTSEINFNVLPRYSESRPPAFGVGPAGPAGQSATIAIGTSTSGPTPAVTNSGTSTDAVLNFQLPKGDKGDTGAGVPTGGTALQVIRKDADNVTTEWATPQELVPLADSTTVGLLEAQDQRLLRLGVPLGASDLNTIVEPGDYHQAGTVNATTANNYPVTGSSCSLAVAPFSSTAGRVQQTITYVSNGRKLYRRSGDGGASWSLWTEYARLTDVSGAIATIPLASASDDGLLGAGELPRIQGHAVLGDEDLDGVLLPGDYYAGSTVNVTAANHYPISGASTNVSVRPISDTRVYQYARALVSGRYFQRFLGSSGTWSEWLEQPRASDLAGLVPQFFMEEQRQYPISMTNTSRFSATSSPRLVRSGNTMELAGVIKNEVEGGTGGSLVTFSKLPPDAIPLTNGSANRQRWFSQFATGGIQYLLYISASGNLNITNLSGAAAASNVYLTASWNVAPPSVYSFERVCARMFAGEDYTRTVTDNGSWLNVMAPHGGEVEKGTSELGKALRDSLSSSWYEWDFLKDSVLGTSAFNVSHEVGNGGIGYKGVKFDDPGAVELVLKSDDCIAIHGANEGTGPSGNGRPPGPITFCGGDNVVFRELVAKHLRLAGFEAWDNPVDFPGLTGLSSSQIHNVAKNRGVQLELSVSQRDAFFTNGDASRPNRGNTTATFTAYRNAVLAAVAEYRA